MFKRGIKEEWEKYFFLLARWGRGRGRGRGRGFFVSTSDPTIASPKGKLHLDGESPINLAKINRKFGDNRIEIGKEHAPPSSPHLYKSPPMHDDPISPSLKGHDHGDGTTFVVSGGELAHAYKPPDDISKLSIN